MKTLKQFIIEASRTPKSEHHEFFTKELKMRHNETSAGGETSEGRGIQHFYEHSGSGEEGGLHKLDRHLSSHGYRQTIKSGATRAWRKDAPSSWQHVKAVVHGGRVVSLGHLDQPRRGGLN